MFATEPNEGPAAIPFAGIRHGHEGAAKFFESIDETMDQITLTIEPFAAHGDIWLHRDQAGC